MAVRDLDTRGEERGHGQRLRGQRRLRRQQASIREARADEVQNGNVLSEQPSVFELQSGDAPAWIDGSIGGPVLFPTREQDLAVANITGIDLEAREQPIAALVRPHDQRA